MASEDLYRPLQWATLPLTYIQVSGTTTVSANDVGSNTTDTIPGTQTVQSTVIYCFDAVLKTTHNQRVTPTSLPVQTGANIADHAFIQPAILELEIGMSDSMAQYSTGQSISLNGATVQTQPWPALSNSKSVGAYQTLVNLQQARTIMLLTTRLMSYPNMLLTNIRVTDDYRSRFGLRASLTFTQIFMAAVSVNAATARGDCLNPVNNGSVSSSGNLNTAQLTALVPTGDNTSSLPTVPGAGVCSDFPIASGPVGI
jgi:hypothetical protein